MTHTTITDAAKTIGINRTTLIEQLHRLESDLGAPLFHRSTTTGQPHRPTRRGTALLKTFTTPEIQILRQARTRLPRVPA